MCSSSDAALLVPMAPELGSLLAAKDDRVARHAAFLLSKIGPDAAPRLLDALRDEKSRVDQIAEALAQIGRPVVPMLTQALKAPETSGAPGRDLGDRADSTVGAGNRPQACGRTARLRSQGEIRFFGGDRLARSSGRRVGCRGAGHGA